MDVINNQVNSCSKSPPWPSISFSSISWRSLSLRVITSSFWRVIISLLSSSCIYNQVRLKKTYSKLLNFLLVFKLLLLTLKWSFSLLRCRTRSHRFRMLYQVRHWIILVSSCRWRRKVLFRRRRLELDWDSCFIQLGFLFSNNLLFLFYSVLKFFDFQSDWI